MRPAEGPTVTGAWRTSAVTGDGLSPRSLQTLRRYDLERLYPGHLTEVVARLHQEAIRDAHPELLFALAEVNYLRGAVAEKKRHPEAATYYYLSAGYAYHYLFDVYPPAATPAGPVQPVKAEVSGPPGEVFDPRFRLACDLYNAGLAKCIAAAQGQGQFDPRGHIYFPDPDGEKTPVPLKVTHTGFTYRPPEFGPVQLCSAYQVLGLTNHHRTFGLGVPLIGTRSPEAPLPPHAYYPRQGCFPITAFLRFEGGLAELFERRAGRLELFDPLTVQQVRVRDRDVPLESDLTTPLAYYLANAQLDTLGYTGFLRPDSLGEKVGIHTLEPYQPGKIPVVMVHGLMASPITWAPMFNDLQADPAIRKRFQFYVYFYPTSNPYLFTAAKLREELAKMRQALDPDGRDPALANMVLVGHSMGGLVSRLMTVDGGDDFWKLASGAPFDSLHLQPATRTELRNTFYFDRQSYVTRAVFLATPHRGSKISPSIAGRLGARLARLPRAMRAITRDIMEENPEAAETFTTNTHVTSIDLLDPDSPALQLIAHRPRPAAVRYHSVIGVTAKNTLLFERVLGGGYCQPSDGVVPYTSARLEDVDSEVVVSADHYRVHHHPLAILEVRRILLTHAREYDEQQPIRHADLREKPAGGSAK
ncbi:MAG: hypothetical protein U0736_14780 [Gemmataceae bacterium]